MATSDYSKANAYYPVSFRVLFLYDDGACFFCMMMVLAICIMTLLAICIMMVTSTTIIYYPLAYLVFTFLRARGARPP